MTLWPPLHSTAQPYFSLMYLAAASMPVASVMVMPERISASGMLGVRTAASGSSSRHRASTASSRSSFAPEVATITGSTTMFFALYCFSFSAMTTMRSAEETMPIFTASGKISVKIASSCSPRNSGVDSRISVTPVVFWAVRAVTALMA